LRYNIENKQKGTKMSLEQLEERQIDQSDLEFLNEITGKVGNMSEHIDNQVNILIGFASAIFLFTINGYVTGQKYPILILAVFAAASICIGLVAIHPFRFLRRRGKIESIMSGKKITACKDASVYEAMLHEVMSTRDKIIHEYSIEIFNRHKYYYEPKRKLYTLTRNVLMAGILLGILTFVANWLINKF
jgi:hypothetical protein